MPKGGIGGCGMKAQPRSAQEAGVGAHQEVQGVGVQPLEELEDNILTLEHSETTHTLTIILGIFCWFELVCVTQMM